MSTIVIWAVPAELNLRRGIGLCKYPPSMKRLIMFDIDGTLTRTQNGFIPFNQAIWDTFGVAGDIRSIHPDGMTDPRILDEILAKSGARLAIGEDQITQFAMHLERSYA
ncbi:MAG: hypothetical protein OEN50_13770, partial [Deltaproteobacteria bacterium]|nr:hypothetical protein [Deltaproteobacteria bacterium]